MYNIYISMSIFKLFKLNIKIFMKLMLLCVESKGLIVAATNLVIKFLYWVYGAYN